mmetsp:Transcript_20341/g.30252  ORF Transcript_20341/g.30252 Transcript_20341/m.30252 type:complete len:240 (-) Transcript_20341:189-908(-)
MIFQQHTLGATVLILLLLCASDQPLAKAFTLRPSTFSPICGAHQCSASRSTPRNPTTALMSITKNQRPAESQEEEEKEKSKKNIDKEWTKIEGGYIPNILRRNKELKTNKKQHNVEEIVTLHDYKDYVVDETDRIVVVRFYASWCRSCKMTAPAFFQLASKLEPDVKFAQVPLTRETAHIHQGLGVQSTPFVHIYHPDVGLVEEMKMNKKTFADFKKTLMTYVEGSCEIPLDEEEDAFQ